MKMKRKTYDDNEMYLFEWPYNTINGEGQHIGVPCVFVRFQGCTVGCQWCDAMGTWPSKKGDMKIGICVTNKELTKYIDNNFPITQRIWVTGGEPTEHSYEAMSFIKYMKKHSQHKRLYHMITSGKKFDVKLLYELNYITIDIKPPSSGAKTPDEFISWCMEDSILKSKIDFKMVVSKTAEDINFARMQIHRLKQFGRDITIQPLYWSESEAKQNSKLPMFEDKFGKPKNWDNYGEFCEEFMDTESYENLRVLPQWHKIAWPGRLSGI